MALNVRKRGRERESKRGKWSWWEKVRKNIYIYVCARFLQVGVGRNGFGSSEMLDA